MEEEDNNNLTSYSLVCPECGVGNPKDARNCLVCDRNLKDTICFMEDDSFDLEVTRDSLVEYRKNFWGTRRTGKTNRYLWDKMEDVEFGSPVNRFIFNYEGRRVVIPLRDENMMCMRKLFKEYEHQ